MDSLRKIVVVDDSAEILGLLSDVLDDEGFQVVCCDAADAALETVASEHPALVILDLTMAGTLTWNLVDTLAADPRTRRTPFIICSGAVHELNAAEDRIRALGGDVLGKPFDLDQLLLKVRNLIASAESA
jgi:DNA-binding response OmpR family regulator